MNMQQENQERMLMNIDAEEAILGSLLLDPILIEIVYDNLPVAAFTLQKHRTIYKACLDLHEKGKTCDFLGVSTFLAGKDILDLVGGVPFLSRLLNRTISGVNIDRYADLILRKQKRRKLQELGNRLTALSTDPQFDDDDLSTETMRLMIEWNDGTKLERKKKEPIQVEVTHHSYNAQGKRESSVSLTAVSNSIEESEKLASELQVRAKRITCLEKRDCIEG